MTTVTNGADGALASSLRISVMRLARRLRAQRSDDALTLSQVSVLATLERYGPLTPTDVAEYEKVQPPSITRVLAALEEARTAWRLVCGSRPARICTRAAVKVALLGSLIEKTPRRKPRPSGRGGGASFVCC